MTLVTRIRICDVSETTYTPTSLGTRLDSYCFKFDVNINVNIIIDVAMTLVQQQRTELLQTLQKSEAIREFKCQRGGMLG